MPIKVRKKKELKNNSTDISLLVSNDVSCEYQIFDKNKIKESLIKEININNEIANIIANNVEEKIIKSEIKEISVSLLRELVDNELFLLGFNSKLKKQKTIGIPTFNLDELIFAKTNENSNLSSNNPEAINMAISENIMKQYALNNVFSEDVSTAHLKGRIHLHDLGCITRNYCSSHSIDFIKKYGLLLENLTTQSAPAKHASTLTGHINTFLSSIQTYYAGALGLANVNIAYAPYLEGMSYAQMLQEAQYLIYSCAQNAFSRGGQTLFIDFNIHTGIPEYMKNLPAIGKGGEYTGKNYIEYEKEAQMFAKALMEVWRKGDKNGQIFAFPKMDLHINNETFEKKEQYELLEFACQISSENGVPYFIFDRDAITLSACCFTGDQKVLIKSSNGVSFLTFKDLYNSCYNDTGKNRTIFHNGSWVKGKLIKIENYKNYLYKITTTNNKEIITTIDHLHPTLRGNVESCNLKDSDYLLFNNLKLDEVLESKKHKGLSYEEGVLIGVYLGDGSFGRGNEIFLSLNENKINKLYNIIDSVLKKYNYNKPIKIYKSKISKLESIRFISDEIKNFILSWVIGDKSYNKTLNKDFLLETIEFRKGILYGLQNTDGTINNRIYSTSKCLIEDMEILLVSLGMQSIINIQDNTKIKGIIRGKEFNRNYPLYCIRYYSKNLNQRKNNNIYKIFNNSIYFRIKNIEALNIDSCIDVYCFKMDNYDEPYFTLPNGIITHNCRLRTTLNMADDYDKMMINHPESMRYCGFQNITINLPQAAYRSGKGNIQQTINDIYESMDICIKAHFQKKEFISSLMTRKGLPLWQMGKPSADGMPYVNLEKASYIIGMVGLNECVQFLTGKQLHEDDETFKVGLKIITAMFIKINEYSKKYNLKFVLEESPAESATRRMAKIDLKEYPESIDYVKGNLNSDEFYYTNSIHFAAGIDMPIIERIQKQSRFHSLIAAGAIIHAFIGEENPSPDSILNLVKKTWQNTNCAQLTISPEFTICNSCHKMTRGIHSKCQYCGAENVSGIENCIKC